MTINEIATAIRATETHFVNDFAGRYDISNTEAERIAARSNSLAEFEAIWENETDWRDQ